MLGKAGTGKRTPAGGDAGNARFLQELEALGRALSLDPKAKPRRTLLPSASDHRSLSAGRPHPSSDPKPKPSISSSKEKDQKPSSSSFWSTWRPLRALSHIRHRRFDCRFSLHVHSIKGLPPALADAALAVHWRRTTDPDSAAVATRPARGFNGAAEFEETLAYRCSVYGARGSGAPHNAAKYEPRQFLIWTALASGAGGNADFGRHLVDLTRLLPLTLEELEEEENRTGRWSTSFRLSGKARGASLNVNFGFSLVRDGSLVVVSGVGDGEGKVLEILKEKTGWTDLDSRRSGGFHRDRSRSVEDVKVLDEVFPSSMSEVSGFASAAREEEYPKFEDGGLDTLEAISEPEFEIVPQLGESPDLKPCTLPEPVKGNGKNFDELPEFMVMEQGILITTKDELCETGSEKLELDAVGKGGGVGHSESSAWPDGQVEGFSSCSASPGESSMLAEDPAMMDVDSALSGFSILESDGVEIPRLEAKTSMELDYSEFKTDCKQGSMLSRSLSLYDVTESVASEFLSMLGIEHSPCGLSSESEPESPRERLWKQFEKESLNTSDDIFGLDMDAGRDSDWGASPGVPDLSSFVLESETELQKETQGMNSKTRAKMLEDAETEALMREWGLNEKAFQRSPPRSRSGFGSPIDLPPEEPIELPPLGEGLGTCLQTKDGGFVRSMSPSLFKNAKNNGSLIMQVSSPVVVPAEMGSDIMEILQHLASVGIEKLSLQAKKLMPLEDISRKTMRQVAWEAAPALEACERHDISQHPNLEAESGTGQNGSGRKKKGKSSNLASSSGGEMSSEYVSLEDLAPLAMDKIEALSIEGLRIQSGMSDEEAPSNINPQSIGDISALEGKESTNSRSLGLEGAAGLQLLDVKDSGDDVDGLMGLSITLDEWMRLDSGVVDEEDEISDRTSKILAAHHACSIDISGGWKGDKKGGKRSGKKWGLLGNNFTVALMVQLRDPLRNYEPVGTPMLALIQVERVFVPPKPKIYGMVSEKGISEQEDEPEAKTEPVAKENKEEEDVIPQFKITEVHVAGLKTEPGKKKVWGNPMQQQSGSRWLLASGMGKSNKHPFMKSKAVAKPYQATTTILPGDTLWSISSRVHGTGAKWKELAALNPHIRNPNVILPNQTIRLH